MKYALSFLMLIAAMAPAMAQDDTSGIPVPMSQTDLLQEPMPGTDVRWFIWGVPREDIIKYEKVILFEEAENALFFIDDVNGIKCLISYEFDRGRLWRVTYDMQKQDYPDPQKIIDDYVGFEIMLNKRYGEPKKKEAIWKNEYYKGKHNRWGLAVYNGDLELGMLWQDERTDAIMTLKAEDFKYRLRIVHTSRQIAAERQQEELRRALQHEEKKADPLPSDLPAIEAPPALRP